MNRPPFTAASGFTLVEILLASVAAALILTAIYTVFQQASRLRDNAVDRIRDTQTRERAAAIVRNDLRNALVSGGVFASIVQGDSDNTDGINTEEPGYLKFTTTTGKDTANELYGDVQQVEYYVTKATGTTGGGELVRSVTRDLLDTTIQAPTENQNILSNVASIQVAFYDGTNWETSWDYNTADSSSGGSGATSTTGSDSSGAETLPLAIRVDIQLSSTDTRNATVAPIEIMVPWTTQPFTSPTPAPTGTPASTPEPSGTPNGGNGEPNNNDRSRPRGTPESPGNPGERGPGGNPGRTKSSVLIVVLVVCLGLVSLTLLLGHTVTMAYRGADNEIAGREADLAIEGAAQYAEEILTNGTAPGAMPDPTTYQAEAVPLGASTFWFIGEPLPGGAQDTPTFGLVDEASKINLNSASATMLENLPGMTQELAEAIVSWRSSSTATTTEAAAASGASSEEKNAPFETVEELAQVDGGTDLDTLYGNDTNLNHVLDPNETSGGPSGISPGLLEYVTVYSRVPNTTSSGTKRVNVTSLSGQLTQLLNTTFGATRGAQIARVLRRAGTIRSVLEFYIKSGMTATEFAKISPQLTASNGAYSVGLINVNTASETVLECVPGITQSTAAQIISTRQGQAGTVTNLSWVAQILGPAASAQAGPYLTAETYQISADVAAVGHNGRGYRRTLFVIDNSTGSPQIVYRRNLSPLGWALGSDARQTLASQPSGSPQGAHSP